MSANPNYKPSEGKREEFRKYLEKTGVMDALTKVLVALYEEPDKPDNAIEFVCNKLVIQICGESFDKIRERLDEAEAKVLELIQQNEADAPQEEGAAPAEGADEAPPEDGQPAED